MVYSRSLKMRSIFPKDFPGTAEKLVEAQINLHILKKALQSPTAATNLACFMEGLAITKLVLVENGLLNIERKPSKANATSKSSKNVSQKILLHEHHFQVLLQVTYQSPRDHLGDL